MTTFHQHTRLLVRVDSHTGSGPTNGLPTVHYISNDVVAMQTSKTTKGRGKFTLKLVPRKNYLNILFPDDVINIYVDPGDGESGFVRLLFGYIDRVEMSETVGNNGEMTTQIIVIGSDFQKAIEKTSIYFNQYLRQTLDERFIRSTTGGGRPFTGNFAGTVLRSAGITIRGTPADFIENFLRVLLGFAQQWQLPLTYEHARPQINELRNQRVQRALKRVSDTHTKQLLADLGFKTDRIDKVINDIIAKINDKLPSQKKEGEKETVEQEKERRAANALHQDADLLALRQLVRAQTDPEFPIGIYDLLHLEFIEALATDGFNQNDTVWQAGNQTLAQWLYGHSNEMVNELIFDLRPANTDDEIIEGKYDRTEDELGLNVEGVTPDGTRSHLNAVRYVPAVVLREYPYSTVGDIDLSNITFLPEGTDSQGVLSPGIVKFGPVFSQDVGTPGRKIYEYPRSINPDRLAFNENAQGRKHLDAVTLENVEVKQSRLGRSDEDVVNVMHMYARTPGAPTDYWREKLSNITPIINHISIARHGLRNRELATEFAYFGGAAARSSGGARAGIARWILLMDHWYQHNPEYLSGSIITRARPDIRVGYRLDWLDRTLSFYVEGVSHQWQYPGAMTTTLQVSRGQRNDPFPAYIPPAFFTTAGEKIEEESGNRSRDGRLGKYFGIRDTNATLGVSGPSPLGTLDNTVDLREHVLEGGGNARFTNEESEFPAGGDTFIDVETNIVIRGKTFADD